MWLATIGTAVAANAQTPPTASPSTASEDIEPRVIGTAGTTVVGFGGFIDRVFSVENVFPTNYFVEVDVARFLTPHVVVTGGLTGMGSIGGDDAENVATGTGARSNCEALREARQHHDQNQFQRIVDDRRRGIRLRR